MKNPSIRPVVLLILDGWGYREDPEHNAIAQAHTPNWDAWWKKYPHTLIQASEASVGLPRGQMGNSEVGHINIGAGRVVYQEYERINQAIADGSFYGNAALCGAVDAAREQGKTVHIMGLLSPGGVHSHEDQILATLRLALDRGASKVHVHAFLDGRDTPPRSALESLQKLDQYMKQHGGRLVSLVGRYYAMDRDHRWDRIQKAYDLITCGEGLEFPDAFTALESAYGRGESDEFVQASRIGPALPMENGDSILFVNFRSDRARQITRAFIEQDFGGFQRTFIPALSRFVTLTEYSEHFSIPVAFPPSRLKNTFGEWISRFGLRQLRIAETEKYAHVTFFFNGGEEQVFDGEDRILIPSPQVATYDLQPAMSLENLADELVQRIESRSYDAIVCNIANPDMVGHSGRLEAAISAVEAVDRALGKIVPAVCAAGGEVIITADHGNVEQMLDNATGQPHTAHTCNPVPVLYIGHRPGLLLDNGALEDVAPSLLHLLEIPKPPEMGGKSLFGEP